MTPAILILLAISAVQVVVEYYTLPATVVSHFGAGGQPNGFMPRDAYCLFHAGIVVLLAITLSMCRKLLWRLPVEMINLPHKQYWLATERRATSLQRLESAMKTMDVAVLGLIVVVMHLVYRANMDRRPLNEPAFIVILVAFLCTLIWNIVRLIKMFPKPPDAPTV